MNRHDRNTCAQDRSKIRDLNDRLRRTGHGGKLVFTQAVTELDHATLMRLLHAVSTFSGFNPNNDPWSEHDFGQVLIDAVPYFWKIDYYDVELEFGSPNPADESITQRVLTILTALDL